jgi:transcriptional regulator with XRE-family HTH domain
MSAREAVEGPTQVDQALRAHRLAMGFASMAALARALNVTPSTVERWEAGQHAPSSRYARRLAILLGERSGGGRDGRDEAQPVGPGLVVRWENGADTRI